MVADSLMTAVRNLQEVPRLRGYPPSSSVLAASVTLGENGPMNLVSFRDCLRPVSWFASYVLRVSLQKGNVLIWRISLHRVEEKGIPETG